MTFNPFPNPHTLLIGVALLLGLPVDANAYVDPGTGSFLFQMIVAGLLGALMYVKMAWQTIKSFFVDRFARNSSETDKEANGKTDS